MGLATSREPLNPLAQTLTPLPTSQRQGLIGVAVLATFSFLASSILFTHLTIKLFQYYRKRWRRDSDDRPVPPGKDVNLDLGLDQHHFSGTPSTLSDLDAIAKRRDTANAAEKKPLPPPNQFVVLLYSLMLADMHQSMSFLLSIVWVARDGIFVQTSTCWAQALLVSTGDLASSCFISAIALHTYLTVVHKYKPSERTFVLGVVGIWAFVYLVTLGGVVGTNNGEAVGGYYARAVAWCWVNSDYELLRLLTHYLWIFASFILTWSFYGLVFLHARKQAKIPRPKPEEIFIRPSTATNFSRKSMLAPFQPQEPQITSPLHSIQHTGHHPAFLIYPLIYVICTSPLAAGRIATMAHANVPVWYFCVAGALVVSNGWLDVLLWSITRQELVFGDIENSDAVGMETFAFMRTPADRQYGNKIWVQGGEEHRSNVSASRRWPTWLSWIRPLASRPRTSVHLTSDSEANLTRPQRKLALRSVSQESLASKDKGMNIQLDMVTSVVYEMDERKARQISKPRLHPRFQSEDLSVITFDESEKDYRNQDLYKV